MERGKFSNSNHNNELEIDLIGIYNTLMQKRQISAKANVSWADISPFKNSTIK